MASSRGSVEFHCDAPPYPIVQACRQLGLHDPEDVRWLRLTAARRSAPGRAPDAAGLGWMSLWAPGQPTAAACTCGAPLPEPGQFIFTFSTGRLATYLLSQCPRCRTIFWEAR